MMFSLTDLFQHITNYLFNDLNAQETGEGFKITSATKEVLEIILIIKAH